MTLCKTLESLTWKVIGLMGMRGLAEAKGKEFSSQRRQFGGRAEEGHANCGRRWTVRVFKDMVSFVESNHHQMCLEKAGLANGINRWEQHARSVRLPLTHDGCCTGEFLHYFKAEPYVYTFRCDSKSFGSGPVNSLSWYSQHICSSCNLIFRGSSAHQNPPQTLHVGGGLVPPLFFLVAYRRTRIDVARMSTLWSSRFCESGMPARCERSRGSAYSEVKVKTGWRIGGPSLWQICRIFAKVL